MTGRTLILILAVFLISTGGLFAHRALMEATPLALAAWRLGLASVFFLSWEALGSRREKAKKVLSPGQVALRLLLAGVCLALHFLTWFAAMEHTSVARATLLVSTVPLWTTLGSALLGHGRVTGRYWLALGLAGLGIAFVTQTSAQPPSRLLFWGDLLATFGGVMFAVYLLAVEGLHTVISTRRQVTVTYSVAAIVLWIVLLIHGGVTLQYSQSVWLALLGMTIGPQIFGHTLLNVSLRYFPSSTVAFATLLEPVIVAVLAWIIFHQALTGGQIFGGILVILSLALVIAYQTGSGHVESEPVG